MGSPIVATVEAGGGPNLQQQLQQQPRRVKRLERWDVKWVGCVLVLPGFPKPGACSTVPSHSILHTPLT